MSRALLAAVLVLAAPALAELPSSSPIRRVVLEENQVPAWGEALARAGVGLAIVPSSSSFALPGRLAGRTRAGHAVVVRPPLSAAALSRLKEAAQDSPCEVVVRAEAGFTFADLAAVERIGPCAFEIHLSQLAPVLLPRLERLRPASIVWESEDARWSTDDLVRLSRLPGPMLSVREGAALAALEVLARRPDLRLALAVRTERGLLSPPVQAALSRDRGIPLRIVSGGGFSLEAAQALRALPRVALEVELRGTPPTTDLIDALLAAGRLVDPPGARKPADADLDGPLLRAPASRR